MKQGLLALLILMLAPVGGYAVHLGETPVQSAMQAGIAEKTLSPPSVRYQTGGEDDFGGSRGPTTSGGKSIFRAALYSALIPGGGQYYLGQRRTARYFFAAEALTWLGYLSFRSYGNWRRDDYIAYAAAHANADLDGKDDEFLAWVGFYDNIRDFNSFGRAWDPERAYLPDTPENHWEWKTDEERQTYRDLKNSSKEAYRRSEFMIGMALLDRVIAVVHAVRSAHRLNRQINVDQSALNLGRKLKLSVNPFSSRRQICFTFYPGF